MKKRSPWIVDSEVLGAIELSVDVVAIGGEAGDGRSIGTDDPGLELHAPAHRDLDRCDLAPIGKLQPGETVRVQRVLLILAGDELDADRVEHRGLDQQEARAGNSGDRESALLVGERGIVQFIAGQVVRIATDWLVNDHGTGDGLARLGVDDPAANEPAAREGEVHVQGLRAFRPGPTFLERDGAGIGRRIDRGPVTVGMVAGDLVSAVRVGARPEGLCSIASERHHLDEHAGQRLAGLLVGDPPLHRPRGLERVGERGADRLGLEPLQVGRERPPGPGIDRDLVDGEIRVAHVETGICRGGDSGQREPPVAIGRLRMRPVDGQIAVALRQLRTRPRRTIHPGF